MLDELPGLVADVGRRSVRFGLTRGSGDPTDVRRFGMAEHSTFTGAVIDYLAGVGLQGQPLRSVLAVAGAARGDLINLTGSRWYISLSGLQSVLRHTPRALNECAAAALALTRLPEGELMPLSGPRPRPVRAGGTYLLLTPSTGLGVSALVTVADRLVPIQSEAAHMTAAAIDADAARVMAGLGRSGLPCSNEALLSADGLSAAYAAFGGRPGTDAEAITRAGVGDPAAAAAVRLFAAQLGALTGDLALAFGAWDGVLLAGPLARALHPVLSRPEFRQRLEAKSQFRRQLADLPVSVVRRTDLELLGAAVALREG